MSQNTNITFIGAPLDLGAEDLGTFEGPQVLREQYIIEKLRTSGLNVSDHGDITARKRSELELGDPLLPYANEIARVNGELAQVTEDSIKNGSRVVAVGGDHSINLGVFSGASTAVAGDIGLIYIDAHGDMNTPDSSLSHNIHGMHLASLMGFGPDVMTKIHNSNVKLETKNLLHLGGSDLDNAEIELIKDEHLKALTMFDILTNGLGSVISAIDELSARVSNVWVSLDLDAIDFLYAPAVGIPNQGGLSYREIAAITEYIGKNCNIIGLDLVEYNPSFDTEDRKTAELSIELIAKLLGTNYSWYTNYMNRQKS